MVKDYEKLDLRFDELQKANEDIGIEKGLMYTPSIKEIIDKALENRTND